MLQLRKDRYALASIVLHWLMALLMVSAYVVVNIANSLDHGSAARALSVRIHETLGLTILLLVWLRMVCRWVWAAPPIEPAPSPWQALVGHAVHLLLYGLMVLMPLLGWLTLSARGRPVPFFIWEFPSLMGPDTGWSHLFRSLHGWGGTLGYVLIGGHAAAALFHHYWVKDNTLRRMW